jgi:hypothetical protein
MTEKSDRRELERRLEQARRIAKEPVDELTNERLTRLIHDLEEQLREGRLTCGPRLARVFL